MTDTVLTGGPANTEKDLTAVQGTIRYDSDNYDVLLHDGVTPGGHRLMSQDNADSRYEAASDELAGLSGFLPEDRGLMIRRGPAQYVTRVLTTGDANLVITNPDGYSGDMDITLTDTIVGEKTFQDSIDFLAVCQFEAGLNADVSGDLTGNVTGNLTGDSAGTHIGAQIGDVDVRGADLLLDDGQIPLVKLDGLDDHIASVGGIVPVGGIIMWSGDITHPPPNWAVCNGIGGTPDLRDRFIVGSGSTYGLGATGGTASHTHAVDIVASGAHDHSLTLTPTALTIAQMAAHTHDTDLAPLGPVSGSGNGNVASVTASQSGSVVRTSDSVGGGATHTHPLNVGANGAHDHHVTSGVTGTLPPYYALVFILRLV